MRKLVSDILEEPGGMRYSLRILFLVGIAMAFDGFDFMIVSYTMPDIMREMELGYMETGSLASWSLVGMLVGGFVSGYLADKVGRKHVMNISIMMYALLTLPIFFVHSYDLFALCRIMSGVFIGAVIPLSVTLVSEYAPTKHRGAFVTVTKMFMMVGWVLAGLVALAVILAGLSWRVCYLIGGLPFLYGVLMHFCIPESVQFCLRKGKIDEAMAIINDINSRLDTPKESGYTADEIEIRPAQTRGQLSTLVSKKYLRVTMGVWLVAFVSCALSYGTTQWMPTMLNEQFTTLGVSENPRALGVGIAVLMNALGCAGALAAGIVADKVGRIKSTYLAAALCAVSVFVASAALGASYVPMIASILVMGFFINYLYTTPQPIVIEVYPTEIRATAQACVTTVARIGGMIIPVLIGALLQSGLGFSSILLAFVVPILLTAVFTKFLIKDETLGYCIEELDEKA